MAISADAISAVFETCAGNIQSIRRDAESQNLADWKMTQITKAGGIGAASAVIPVAGYLTMPADLAALARLMHRSAIGICEIKLGYADEETFAGVLSVWCGATKLDSELAEQIQAQMLAQGAVSTGGVKGIKMAIKGFTLVAKTLLAKKLTPKVAQKVAALFAKKLAAKASTRWIPIISAIAGGGVNLWVMDGLNEAAEKYSDFILQINEK